MDQMADNVAIERLLEVDTNTAQHAASYVIGMARPLLEPADHVPTTPHGWDDDIQHGMMAHGVDLGFIRNEAPDELDDSSDDSAEDSDSDVPIRCVVCDLVEHNCDWRVGLL